MYFPRTILFAVSACFCLGEVGPGRDDPVARVVILANVRQPESVELARFYAAQRGVPEANIVALPLPEDESITWRRFIDQVWQPVQDELYRRGWIQGVAGDLLDRYGRRRCAPTGHRISYLVVCRGVPLRIYNDPVLLEVAPVGKVPDALNKNEGAVDGELCRLAMPLGEITGWIPNPCFRQDGSANLASEEVVKVSRLDGPTWESAHRLVTSALAGERQGLHGRYYVDEGGRDKEGDKWLEGAVAELQGLGFEGDTETTAMTFAPTAPFDLPIFYFGWYERDLNGPFSREGFAFPPGAVAVHIHSYSAQTLRSTVAGWCGPFVARGVAATVGNVFEPYLEYTHRPDLLVHALGRGERFGDAAYYSLPVLSWQAVAIGDPLYQPFKRKQ
ncbi:MAG TPA: TIGR03790 family protein [Lacunisphaera sp.]|nr:TIGR03790 family protein [Lacunisphaera sp.]